MAQGVMQKDIENALHRIGIKQGDTVLVHSSLKSFGHVENGADTVIDALLAGVGSEGTVVFPTFVQEDFQNAYKTWYMDKPSDTGRITEIARKRADAYRSNQATHSVAAIGRDASFLTKEHGESGKRNGIFGDTPFAKASPWQKMYDRNAVVLLCGVGFPKNTFMHFWEYIIAEKVLEAARKNGTYESVSKKLRCFETRLSEDQSLHFPRLRADCIDVIATNGGFLQKEICGAATLTKFHAMNLGKAVLADVATRPWWWFPKEREEWIRRAFNGDIPADAFYKE